MATQTTDIVIPLGSESCDDNLELRFTLRSIEACGSGVGRVIVIGSDPGFLSKHVTHVPYKETERNREARVAAKLTHACGVVRSDEFLLFNDDFFMLKPFACGSFPTYHKGTLEQHLENRRGKLTGTYTEALRVTRNKLLERGHKDANFGLHCPMIVNVSRFLGLRDWWEESATLQNGYLVRSVYGNVYSVESKLCTDYRVISECTKRYAKLVTSGRPWFSVSDAAFKSGVKDMLQEVFPDRSKYEV